MKKIILALLLFSAILFSQWVQQYPPSDIELILSIDFANTNTGAAGGWGGGYFGKAVYTTNSGINWYMAQVPDSSRSMVKVQLIDNNTGYIAGAYNIFKNENRTKSKIAENSRNRFLNYFARIGMTGEREDYRGLFLKTTNGGKNWITLDNLPSNVYYLMGMKFINVNTGFVSASLDYSGGVKNAVLKTTNGGLNWNSIYQIDTADINNIYTSDGISIFVSGWKQFSIDTSRGMILKTTNGGSTWNVQFFIDAAQISDVNFTNSLTGFAVSNLGSIITGNPIGPSIYKTITGGSSWLKVFTPDSLSSLYSVEFVPGTGKGIAAGFKFNTEFLLESLLLCRTTNYGLNWTKHVIPDSVHLLHSSSLVDANTWFVGGGIENAIIYKTTNGGVPIGIEPISSEVPNQFSLSQNYPNPFNPSTKIKFSIPPSKGARGMTARLIIFDILGGEVAVLVSEQLNPGTYEVNWDGSNYPSGVYFCKLTSEEYSSTIKLILLK